jgi:phosphoribosylanthranilate isomerase
VTPAASGRRFERRSSPVFHKTIQVAGIASYEEARMLLDCGVDYLGFPLKLPVHRQDVNEREARKIVARVGDDRAVLITYLDTAQEIRALVDVVGVAVVQLHASITVAELAALRASSPDLTIIKSIVIHPGKPLDFEGLMRLDEDRVDAYIADTFDPRTGASGATGRTHDWAVSRSIVAESKRPVILAGGLRPDNVAEAIRVVRPSAGVEDEHGRKSKRLIEQFVEAAHTAFDSA